VGGIHKFLMLGGRPSAIRARNRAAELYGPRACTDPETHDVRCLIITIFCPDGASGPESALPRALKPSRGWRSRDRPRFSADRSVGRSSRRPVVPVTRGRRVLRPVRNLVLIVLACTGRQRLSERDSAL